MTDRKFVQCWADWNRWAIGCLIVAGLSAGLLTGCGSSGQPVEEKRSVISGPHGGPAYPIADGSGYIEVVREMSDNGQPILAAYVLAEDQESPAESVPDTITAELTLPDGSTQTATLEPAPKSGDSVGSARLASDSGEMFGYDELAGTLEGTYQGSSFTIEFGFR